MSDIDHTPPYQELWRADDEYFAKNYGLLMRTHAAIAALVVGASGSCFVAAFVYYLDAMRLAAPLTGPMLSVLLIFVVGTFAVWRANSWLHEWMHAGAMWGFGAPTIEIEAARDRGAFRLPKYYVCRAPEHTFSRWQFMVVGVAPQALSIVAIVSAIWLGRTHPGLSDVLVSYAGCNIGAGSC